MDEIPKEKHDHKPLKFPDGFFWGAATSAHQVEGGNINSDWWDWELHNQPPDFRSGRACDSYNLYEEDFQIAKDLNQNAHRLSIEWARIEPREGQFDEQEIDHYKKVLRSLKDKDFKVMLTLWHFTLPKWVADKGGWENPKTVDYFLRFIGTVVPHIKEYVDFWITLNEPGVYVVMSYILGEWPPQMKSKVMAAFAYWNLAQAHKRAYKLLHQLASSKNVGIAHNVQSFSAYHKHSLMEQMAVIMADLVDNHSFYLLTDNSHDFIGINYYFHHRFNLSKGLIPNLSKGDTDETTHEVSDLGWEIHPQGIFDVLTDLKDHKPIYITECGIASTNDDRRTRFLIGYLQEVFHAIEEGVPVKGFFYWSLLDNFEWHRGFEPRFGLVEIDYTNQKRRIRPSAYVYSEIAKSNSIPHHFLRLLGHTINAKDVLCYKHNGPKALCGHIY